MQIKIHRGVDQIGGCITEIKSKKARILIDVGTNLPNTESKVKVNVSNISKKCDAVFITHYHLDHIGEYMKVKKKIPIYIGEQAKDIFMIYQKRMNEPKIAEVTQEHIDRLKTFKTFETNSPIVVDDMKITPIRVDHSAYDSYMFLVETEGKKLLHTGDFRTHGPIGKDIPNLLKGISKVDTLICEHTTLSRTDATFMTEEMLQNEAINLIKDNKYVFIMCASTNIDRIASFYHANKQAGNKVFICDDYQLDILNYVTKTSKDYTDYYDFSDAKHFDGKIDDDTFNKVQEMMFKNKKAPARARAKTEYLLTTKLFCGHCKDLMTGYSGTSKTGKLHNYYMCNNARKKLCGKKAVQKDYIEDLVVNQARAVLTDDNIKRISTKVVELANKEKDSGNLRRLNKLLKENETQKKNLFDSLKICNIDAVKQSIFEEINKMEIEHQRIINEIAIEESQHIKLTVNEVKFFLVQLRKGNINDIKYRRLLINTLIYQVFLYDDSITIVFNTQGKPYEKKIPRPEVLESSLLGNDALPIFVHKDDIK